MSTEVVFAAYKPHTGKENELKELIDQHFPVLQELELVTSRQPLVIKSKDGTFIEVIEWANANAANQAHEHPKVAKIWESMGKICDFVPLNKLPETEKPFSHYQVVV